MSGRPAGHCDQFIRFGRSSTIANFKTFLRLFFELYHLVHSCTKQMGGVPGPNPNKKISSVGTIILCTFRAF